MRVMYIIKTAHQGPPSLRLMEEIGKMSEEAVKSGAMIDSGGLMPLAMGARIRVEGGKLEVIDGPFAESKEVVGGYAIFEVKTREEALESGIAFMNLHKEYGEGWEGECEMRVMATEPPCAD